MPVADGLLVVDKPAGWTSHDVVGRARRLCGTRRVGHAGTLGRAPRSFTLSPPGDLLVVANLESDGLTTFRVDTGSGVLTPLTSTHDIPAPRWVGFL